MTVVPRNAVRLLATAVLLYVLLCGVVFLNQRNMIFFPQPRSPGHEVSTVVLPVDGAQVMVTVQQRPGANALIYFGGNGEDVSYHLPDFSQAFPEYAIYLPDYRGYGGSSGKPSEAALVADALVLFDKIHSEHRNVVVVGCSLGSGVAVQLASQRPVARLILVTPYSSLLDLAAAQFPYLPTSLIMLDKFESWKFAAHVVAPTFIVAAERDQTIPRSSTEKLYRHFRAGVASMKVITGVGHNSISESPDYMPALQAALQ